MPTNLDLPLLALSLDVGGLCMCKTAATNRALRQLNVAGKCESKFVETSYVGQILSDKPPTDLLPGTKCPGC